MARGNFKLLSENYELDTKYLPLNFTFPRELCIAVLFDLRATPSLYHDCIFYKRM